MKILVVTQYFWPENFRINDLTKGLMNRGHQVTVLTGIPNYPNGRFFPGYGLFKPLRSDHDGAKVFRVPLVPRGKAGAIQLALNYFSFALFAVVLGPFLCNDKYDIILVPQFSPVTVGLPAILMKKIKKIPIVFWIFDLWPESLSATGAIKSKKLLAIVESLVGSIYKRCDRIIVVSKGFISSVRAKGIEDEKIYHIPNWYETEYQIVSSRLEEKQIPALPKGFCVMFAGNIGVAQDFECILAAAEKIKDHSDIHWVVLGDGSKYEWLKEQVVLRGLSNQMYILGRYPPDLMGDFFSRADVMLVALKRDPIFALTVPGKIQSYMACGRPIVAALDGEGARILVEAGAGLVSSSEDVDGLARIVLSMYRMPKEEREAMGVSGRKYCEQHFNREVLIDRLEGWMLQMVGRLSVASGAVN